MGRSSSAGGPIARSIAFNSIGATLFGLPLTEGVSILGALLAAIVVVGFVLVRRSRTLKRPPKRGGTGARSTAARGPTRTNRPGIPTKDQRPTGSTPTKRGNPVSQPGDERIR